MERIQRVTDMDIISFEDQCDLSRNLKGAPASILLALLLSGRSMTAVQLEVATSYSDKPIRKALSWLEPRCFVQYNGLNSGWSLGPAAITVLNPVLSRLVPTQPQREEQGEIITLSPGVRNGRIPKVISRHSSQVEYQLAPQIHAYSDRNISDHPISQSRTNSDSRTNSEQPSEILRTSLPADQISPDPGSDLLDGLYKPSADQQQSDLIHENRKNSELALLLNHVGICKPAFSYILETCETALVLAWWWYSFEKNWLDNPNGWLIRCLESQDKPRAPYLELAQAWLALGENEKSEMRSSCFIHGDLERFWRDRGLSRTAVYILTPIHRSGGFKVFDNDE